ncbi:MAG: exo-alpha-sialidase, partial [Bacteroidetes bacterium]|nr:exo-alpha-sialidase [Bacteroidota bacterium]
MKKKNLLMTAIAIFGLTTITMAQVPNWTQIGPVDDYKNIIQLTNGNFVSSANNDVYVFQNTTSTFTALNFNSQIGSLCVSQLLGENSAGSIFRASCHNGIYKYNNSNWTLNGLSGFGTGGQYWNNLSSGRLIISKGGFLRNIYYSDNDGSNWISAGVGNVDWNFLVVSQNQSLFAVSCCGGSGQKGLIKSTDNGTSWSYLNSSVPLSTARCIANDLNGTLYVIGDEINIKNSIDDGNTWSQFSTTPNNEIGYNLLFSQDAMFLFTNSGPVSKIYYSPLNTINWQDISTSFPANSFFNEMKYLDGKVFVCTNNGLFYASCQQPAQPTTACYETATFNNTTCQWNVTGSQPAQPTTACYETASFNTNTCEWDVTGTQPEQPSTACYETASFNTNTCQWDVTGSQPEQPSTACYETASFNTSTCQWDVTGTQPEQPNTACYETASFNTSTCQWDVTGSQPEQPSTACYETASFNTSTCQWDVTGTQPTQPTTACYETASFNTSTCQWDVTGTQPEQPSTACYETASFNTSTCQWDVTGSPASISQPTNQTVNVNNNAQFSVGSSDPNASYQWQTDLGMGFQNINSVGQYSGTTTNTLSVSNVSMSNNNQPF